MATENDKKKPKIYFQIVLYEDGTVDYTYNEIANKGSPITFDEIKDFYFNFKMFFLDLEQEIANKFKEEHTTTMEYE